MKVTVLFVPRRFIPLLQCLSCILLPLAVSAEPVEYDAQHRLIGATFESGDVLGYFYDAVGNRLKEAAAAANGVSARPNIPACVAPLDNGADIPALDVMLTWTGGTSGSDSIAQYDIYFGESPNPPLYRSAITATAYNLPLLKSLTKY